MPALLAALSLTTRLSHLTPRLLTVYLPVCAMLWEALTNLVIISIKKYLFLIGSLHTYLLHKCSMIMWVSNYNLWLDCCNWAPALLTLQLCERKLVLSCCFVCKTERIYHIATDLCSFTCASNANLIWKWAQLLPEFYFTRSNTVTKCAVPENIHPKELEIPRGRGSQVQLNPANSNSQGKREIVRISGGSN